MSNFFATSMKPLRHLVLAASALTLVACASATPYQPASKPGAFDGFSQQMIENDRARVTFGGNSLTNRETVENYLLYRAAEVAVERGFETFTLQERDTEAKTRTQITPGLGRGFGYDPYFGYSFYRPSYGWSRNFAFSRFGGFRNSRGFARRGFGRRGFGSRGFGGGGFFDDDFDVRQITKYRATAEVKFGRNNFNSEDPRMFNAREVLENLGGTIELPS